MKSRVEGIIRLIVAIVPAINIVLVYFGKTPLPFSSDEINVALSAVVEFIGILWAWWKNNNMTKGFQISQKIGEDINASKGKIGGEAE